MPSPACAAARCRRHSRSSARAGKLRVFDELNDLRDMAQIDAASFTLDQARDLRHRCRSCAEPAAARRRSVRAAAGSDEGPAAIRPMCARGGCSRPWWCAASSPTRPSVRPRPQRPRRPRCRPMPHRRGPSPAPSPQRRPNNPQPSQQRALRNMRIQPLSSPAVRMPGILHRAVDALRVRHGDRHAPIGRGQRRDRRAWRHWDWPDSASPARRGCRR